MVVICDKVNALIGIGSSANVNMSVMLSLSDYLDVMPSTCQNANRKVQLGYEVCCDGDDLHRRNVT